MSDTSPFHNEDVAIERRDAPVWLVGILAAGVVAFVVLSSPTAFQYSTRFAEFTLRNRMPAISPFRPFAVAGGLMSYAVDGVKYWGQGAVYVDRILKGEKPADLPVQQPTDFELVINAKTAKALGITIPPSLLARADKLIE